MKEIKAFIRCERALKVLDALCEAGMKHATLTHVLAVGSESEFLELICSINEVNMIRYNP